MKKHGDFHQRPKCRDVSRAGNWILAQMGVLLARGICGSASTWTTYGTCVETWIFSIFQIQDFEHILHMLVEAIKVLQSLMEELPATMHEAVQWSETESALQPCYRSTSRTRTQALRQSRATSNWTPSMYQIHLGAWQGTAPKNWHREAQKPRRKATGPGEPSCAVKTPYHGP